jgi:hypothetical protein
VIEDGRWTASEEGSPQGATVSPLLANVYLHYVFDLWVQQWRSRHARGEVIVVRYADDVVLGFQHQSDAERFRKDLEQRLAEFGLALNADKTRLMRFGRFAFQQRAERGLGRPETFDFLGFTHYCAKTKDGRVVVRRRTIKKRMAAKLKEVKASLMARRHWPIDVQGRWLGAVVRGHFAYYSVPDNIHQVSAFREAVVRLWRGALRRRSQTPPDLAADATPHRSMAPTPPPHPSLAQRALRRQNPSQEPSALDAHAGSARGAASNGGPYRDLRACTSPSRSPGVRRRASDEPACSGLGTRNRRRTPVPLANTSAVTSSATSRFPTRLRTAARTSTWWRS